MNRAPLSRRPAVRLAMLFVAGILLAARFSIPLATWYIALVVVLTLSGMSFMVHWHRIGDGLIHLLVLVAACALHAYSTTSTNQLVLDARVANEQIELTGPVRTLPQHQGKHFSFLVETHTAFFDNHEDRTDRQLIVIVPDKKAPSMLASLEIGSLVRIKGVVQPFPRPRNPGDFDYGRFLKLNDIHGTVAIRDSSAVELLSHAEGWNVGRAVAASQQWLYSVFDSFHSKEHSSFLKGIVLGYRADISAEIKQSFIDTGTIHILAVSGSNVAVVALVFLSVFGLMRMPRRMSAAATMIALVAYMFVTGGSPSVERATIMGIVLLSGRLFERNVDVYNSLAVAAIILFLLNTNTLFDVGFQLSFAAVWSIVFFYPKLEQLIKRIPERFEEIKAVDAGLKLFAVSLAAQLGTLPFTAYYFGRVSVVSLGANLIVVPIAGLNTIIGFAEVAFAPISCWLAECFVAVNDVLTWFLLAFVRVASNVPYAVIETPTVDTLVTIIYYFCIVVLFLGASFLSARRIVFVGLIVASLIAWWPILHEQKPVLRITMLDVGQGDALLAEFPNGKRLLVDAGPKTFSYDAGERLLLPYLRRRGIASIDAVMMSHAHDDHIGGMLALLDRITIGRIIHGESAADSKFYRQLLQKAHEKGIAVETLHAGSTCNIDSLMRLYVLNPTVVTAGSRNLNNASVVVKAVYGKSSVLMVGDAEEVVEESMEHSYFPLLRSDMLKVGHHGSITGSSERFLNGVHPAIALISVGTNNKFGHPSPAVVARMRQGRARVHRTDLDGAIVYESDGTSWREVHWRN